MDFFTTGDMESAARVEAEDPLRRLGRRLDLAAASLKLSANMSQCRKLTVGSTRVSTKTSEEGRRGCNKGRFKSPGVVVVLVVEEEASVVVPPPLPAAAAASAP